MIDPRTSPELTPERLAQIKQGRDPASDASHAIASRMGGTPGATAYRPRALHADPAMISPRWPFAVARIHRILEGGKASSFDRAVETSECPKLAKQYVETWLYYMTRSRPSQPGKVDHNPFRGLSDTDAMRKFVRCVENICDASSSKLGGWYVK